MKKLKIFVAMGVLTISALLGFTACGGEEILTPTGFEIEENRLTWEDVDNARSYVIEIKNAESGEIKNSSSNRENLSLAFLDVGDYEIRVKAIGANAKDESEWSEVLYFKREYESGCIYKLVNNTEYQVYRVGSAVGDVFIEAEYRNKPVTSIANKAFYKSGKITGIELSENVKTIGDNAFYNCVNLTRIDMPETITSLGVSAFQGCHRLTEVNIPDALTELKEYTFAYCRSLKQIEIPATITQIGDSAFFDCESLEGITIPDSVEYVGENAFAESIHLKTVTIGKGVESIGEYAFNKCNGLESLTFAEKSGLKTIGERAFAETFALSTLVLPEGLEEVGFRAFSFATGLGSVTVPSTLKKMGAFAFDNTKLLIDQASDSQSNGLIYAGDWVVGCIDTAKLTLSKVNAALLKENTVGVADRVFMSSPVLKEVIFPATVKYVGDYAFYNCPSLWSVDTLNVESLGDYSFSVCGNLSNLILGEGLKTIGSHAFETCKLVNNSSLGGSIIPENVTSIGTEAFKDTGLWGSTALMPDLDETEESDGVIYAGNWVVGYSKESAYVHLKEGTVGIADYAFFGNGALKEISGLRDVKYIGRGAFYECTALNSISLPRSLKVIEDYTFYKCTSLVSISMPAKLQSIGRSAFYKCTRLTSMDLSSSDLTTIAPYAFYSCTGLQEIEFNDSLATIDEYAFYKCTSLLSLTLPDSMQSIGERAYYKCENLRLIDFGGTVRINNYAFYACSALQEVTLPDTVQTVGRNAFYKCTAVKDVVFGAGLQSIGDYAFYGLQELRELNVPTGVEIGNYVFKGAGKLTSVLVKSEVETIGAHTFYGGTGLTIYTDAKNVDEAGWNNRWNSSYRPVVWGCTLSEDGTYVASVTIEANSLENVMANGGFTAPQRAGYVFIGWATSATATEHAYTASEIVNVPVGTTVYSLWDTFVPTVRFIHNVEGCELLEKEVVYGELLEVKEQMITTAEGYEFAGFYLDADMVTPFDFTKPITRDTEVYVKWEKPESEDTGEQPGEPDSQE